MKLRLNSIEEFIKIYRTDYGVILDIEQAEEMAYSFLQLIQAIYKPIPKVNEDDLSFLKKPTIIDNYYDKKPAK